MSVYHVRVVFKARSFMQRATGIVMALSYRPFSAVSSTIMCDWTKFINHPTKSTMAA